MIYFIFLFLVSLAEATYLPAMTSQQFAFSVDYDFEKGKNKDKKAFDYTMYLGQATVTNELKIVATTAITDDKSDITGVTVYDIVKSERIVISTLAGGSIDTTRKIDGKLGIQLSFNDTFFFMLKRGEEEVRAGIIQEFFDEFFLGVTYDSRIQNNLMAEEKLGLVFGIECEEWGVEKIKGMIQ